MLANYEMNCDVVIRLHMSKSRRNGFWQEMALTNKVKTIMRKEHEGKFKNNYLTYALSDPNNSTEYFWVKGNIWT